MRNISIIVAVDRNNAIGKNGSLPWHLPSDLAYFKQTTIGRPVIMGRKTYDSLKAPLIGRDNIIVTSKKSFNAHGCTIAHNLNDALALASYAPEIFIAGGESIYMQAIEISNKIYITRIDTEITEADAHFPPISKEWKLTSSHPQASDPHNPYKCIFEIYERTHD